MPQIGVRELKNQTSSILKNVRNNQAKYIVTYHGSPVAAILPLNAEWTANLARKTEAAIEAALSDQAIWKGMDELRREIDRKWQSNKSAVELIAEQRR